MSEKLPDSTDPREEKTATEEELLQAFADAEMDLAAISAAELLWVLSDRMVNHYGSFPGNLETGEDVVRAMHRANPCPRELAEVAVERFREALEKARPLDGKKED